ncbi:MAG UNVERIFIED_CONTAM: hypothetical protein LVR18_03080 [Planctomycetaceae bacterium]
MPAAASVHSEIVGICGQAVDCFGIENICACGATVDSHIIGQDHSGINGDWVICCCDVATGGQLGAGGDGDGPIGIDVGKIVEDGDAIWRGARRQYCHGAGICRRDSGCHVQTLSRYADSCCRGRV